MSRRANGRGYENLASSFIFIRDGGCVVVGGGAERRAEASLANKRNTAFYLYGNAAAVGLYPDFNFIFIGDKIQMCGFKSDDTPEAGYRRAYQHAGTRPEGVPSSVYDPNAPLISVDWWRETDSVETAYAFFDSWKLQGDGRWSLPVWSDWWGKFKNSPDYLERWLHLNDELDNPAHPEHSWYLANSGQGELEYAAPYTLEAEVAKWFAANAPGPFASAPGTGAPETDAPGTPTPAPATPTDTTAITDFVTRLYRLILEREPDAKGLSDWTAALANKTITGADAAHGFVFSNEMNAKNLTNEEFVDVLYRAFLGREPDAAGRAGLHSDDDVVDMIMEMRYGEEE